jgi:hypothetical protein
MTTMIYEMLNLSDTFLIVCPIIGIVLALISIRKYSGLNLAFTIVSIGVLMLNLVTEINRVRFSSEDE